MPRNRHLNLLVTVLVALACPCQVTLYPVVADDEVGQPAARTVVDANLKLAGEPQARVLQAYARVNAALARRVCTLTEREEAQLALMTDAWLAKLMQPAPNSPLQQLAAGKGGLLRGRDAEAVVEQRMTRLKLAIDKHIEQSLTPEHAAAFEIERQAREQFRNAAQADVLVAALDARLFLAPAQREQLSNEIELWLKKEVYWQFYFQNPNYVPDIPRNVLSKTLTPEQLDSLKGAQAWLYELSQLELQKMDQGVPVLIDQ
jgi:hypothetical protein